MRKAGDFVEEITAGELNSGGYGFAAELVGENGEAADAVVTVVVGQISSALKETGDCGLACSGSGLVESGFSGLSDQ